MNSLKAVRNIGGLGLASDIREITYQVYADGRVKKTEKNGYGEVLNAIEGKLNSEQVEAYLRMFSELQEEQSNMDSCDSDWWEVTLYGERRKVLHRIESDSLRAGAGSFEASINNLFNV